MNSSNFQVNEVANVDIDGYHLTVDKQAMNNLYLAKYWTECMPEGIDDIVRCLINLHRDLEVTSDDIIHCIGYLTTLKDVCAYLGKISLTKPS